VTRYPHSSIALGREARARMMWHGKNGSLMHLKLWAMMGVFAAGCSRTAGSMPDATVAGDAAADIADGAAPSDRGCVPTDVSIPTLFTCPSCFEGRWWVYGSYPGSSGDGFSMEVTGCEHAVRCLLNGAMHGCSVEDSTRLRVYVDTVGYEQLLFTLGCDRMLGQYLSEGGDRSPALRAEHEDRDAGAPPSDGCSAPPNDAGTRTGFCGPCGARWSVNDTGVEACERLTNGCGGCNPSVPRPGESCGSGHYYFCSGPEMALCTMGDPTGSNACGGRTAPLPHAPGDPCGTERDCRYVCQSATDVTCWCPPSGDAGADARDGD
jgi:hypothetical protein